MQAPAPPARGGRGVEGCARAATAPALADAVAFLARPGALPGSAAGVRALETHRSWVFLTADRAYKLKKPVRTALLDFSSAAARGRCCREELRLNRPLAPGVYLGVRPLLWRDGALALDGAGEVVDWLVEMRRLPAGRTLEDALRVRALPPGAMPDLGARLAAFYATAARAPLLPEEHATRVAQAIEANGVEVLRLGDDDARAHRLRARLAREAARLAEALARRARAGRVVEGHGDLRPEHVWLLDPPLVIDALEFNATLRQVDAADELAGLALECERLGDLAAGAALLDGYARTSGDAPPAELLRLYRDARALLGAKLALWHLETPPGDRARWMARAREYLALADLGAAA